MTLDAAVLAVAAVKTLIVDVVAVDVSALDVSAARDVEGPGAGLEKDNEF